LDLKDLAIGENSDPMSTTTSLTPEKNGPREILLDKFPFFKGEVNGYSWS